MKHYRASRRGPAFGALIPLLLAAPSRPAHPAPSGAPDTPARIEAQGFRLEFDGQMRSRVVASLGGVETALGPYQASETLLTATGEVSAFALEGREERPVRDILGPGRRVVLTGQARGAATGLRKTVAVTVYEDFPRFALFAVRYSNESAVPVEVSGWTGNRYALEAPPRGPEPAFWSYQPGSYERRPDWVLPIAPGFAQDNDQGMNATDYGGGTPIADVWRREIGLAVGHVELVPKLVSLPVTRRVPEQVTLAVSQKKRLSLKPGESFETLRTFVRVHHGDHFETLADYRRLMIRQGVVIPRAPREALEPIWCAWGYGRGFTPRQVFETLPVAKRLGFGWAVLDDGWQVAEGDWVPVPTKFPAGDADMKGLVDRIHEAGLKAQLWWAPLAVDPGTRLEREHPDQILLNADGSRQKITWWDSFYLCPAYGPVRDDARAFVRKAVAEWGFDGLKIDGQHLNAAPPCFNPAHHHRAPEDAFEGVPGFFKAIWDEAMAARPDALVEICPCGTAYSFFTMPYLNMVVASDPQSSWQVRLKGKTLKALLGDGVAYFGDHVEMSEGGTDFASTLGVGGVIGTNFAWPGASGKKDAKLLLTPAREKTWSQWVKLYQEKRLSEGDYLGALYDIGFDRPEAHAIRKGATFYYAFFAERFSGSLQLRGLGAGRYRVRDYEAGRDLGVVSGPTATLTASFAKHLLLEVQPE
jgi:alpha-galactosidase